MPLLDAQSTSCAGAKRAKPSTRELSRIVSFYLRNVRKHDKSEYVGVYRQMLLMIDKGVTAVQMAQAVRNYAKSEFVKSIPQVRRHHIRRFFIRERIRQWAVHQERAEQARSLVALDHLIGAARAAQIAPVFPGEARTAAHVSMRANKRNACVQTPTR